MADFRGVPSEEVADSFARAVAFLRECNLGLDKDTQDFLCQLHKNDHLEKTASVLAQWQTKGVAETIRQAEDHTIVAIMRQTGALPMLSLYHDLFAFHAATEALEGKSEEIQTLYRDLTAWGAFFDPAATPEPLIAKEISTHIVLQALKQFAGMDSASAAIRDEALTAAVSELAGKDERFAEWLEMSASAYMSQYDSGAPEAVAGLMATGTSSQDTCLQKTFARMCGLPESPEIPGARSPIERYKVTLANPPDAPDSLPAPVWAQHTLRLSQKFMLAMAPFVAQAQIARIEMLPMTTEKDKWGLSFYATRPAAEKAAAFMAGFNYDVVDSEGQPLRPAPGAAPDAPHP